MSNVQGLLQCLVFSGPQLHASENRIILPLLVALLVSKNQLLSKTMIGHRFVLPKHWHWICLDTYTYVYLCVRDSNIRSCIDFITCNVSEINYQPYLVGSLAKQIPSYLSLHSGLAQSFIARLEDMKMNKHLAQTNNRENENYSM